MPWQQPTPTEIPTAEIARIKELYSQGLYQEAFDLGQAFGPIRTWSGPAARLIAGRLAVQLGAQKLGRQLHLAIYRESPTYPEAIYYHARYRLERFGPLSAWQFIQDNTDWSIASPELKADWAILQAFVMARLQDFERAEQFIEQSVELAPDRPWHYVEQSSVFELQGRLGEALESAETSLKIQTLFRPGVQAVAHILTRLNRSDDALALLQEASAKLQSGLVTAQLASLQIDRKMYREASESMAHFEKLSPLLDKDTSHWLHARKADLAYWLGDAEIAQVEASQIHTKEDTFYQRMATSLANRDMAMSLPATTNIDFDTQAVQDGRNLYELFCQYWKTPAPEELPAPRHLLEGLPDSSLRQAFEAAGWVVREWTLNFGDAVKLIDAGLPFFTTFVESGFAQDRIVFGCDRLRDTLRIYDGNEQKSVEGPIQTILERFGSTGPHCFVAVPASATSRLNGIELQDANRWQALHQLQVHLSARQLTQAKDLLERIQQSEPEELITKLAEFSWAKNTQHPVLIQKVSQALLRKYPGDSTYVMIFGNVLRELGLHQERLAFLDEHSHDPEADPILQQSLAQVLLSDPDRDVEAEQLIRRSLRERPQMASGYFLLATLKWDLQEFEEAFELYRFACCLEEHEEQFADAFIRAAKSMGRTSEVVRFFQRRLNRAPVPHPAAVKSLYDALIARGEADFADTALLHAIEKLTTLAETDHTSAASDTISSAIIPSSMEMPSQEVLRQYLGELRLFYAEELANRGDHDEAADELETVKSLVAPAAWLKTAARVARTQPRYQEALQHLKALAELEPLNTDVQRLTVGLLLDTQGKRRARTYLISLTEQFPHVYSLQKLCCEYLLAESDDMALTHTQRLLELCPQDAWALRQCALLQADALDIPEALKSVAKSAEYEPNHPSYFTVKANILRRNDQVEEAIEVFQDGLRNDIDHEFAIVEMVRTARGLKEKKAVLRFVAEQLHQQNTNGEGLVAYRDQALPLIDDPEEQDRLYQELEKFLDERPDLWQTWSLVIQQLLMMHRPEEARSLARQATKKFPMIARLWLDLAEAYRMTNQVEKRIEALRQSLTNAPAWTPAAKELADAYVANQEHDMALEILEEHIRNAPLDPLAHGFLADQLWNHGESEQACHHAEISIRLEPGYDWAWGALASWSERLEQPEAIMDLARDLSQDRAGDARVFMKLARTLGRNEQVEEALAALDQAISLDPNNPESYDLKAEKLAELGRYDEALAAANPASLLDELPLILQGRAAWIEAERGNYPLAISSMQALVSIDPGYYWGWQQLAEWYNDTGKSDAYLEATEEMVKLRPDHPTPLAMRGEAFMQTQDRERAKADLREALRLHPGYSPAAAILFDACLADGEFREARAALAVLQEHLAGPEVLVKQIAYACKANEPESAIRAFREICQTPNEGPPNVMQLAFHEMRLADWEQAAIEVMKEAWESDEPFNPWAAIFWLDTPSGEEADAEIRLACCDAVLSLYPKFIPGHDRRAEQLAKSGLYAEALEACQPDVLLTIPITLRGRAAWINALKGDTHQAIEIMQKCLQDDPEYSWGWRQLAHWSDDLGRHRECLEAADQLIRLAPFDPYAYGIRGEAKRILGDHRGAMEDYQRAYDLDPHFSAAGHQLISEQLATDDLTGATKTLATLREYAAGPLLQLRSLQLSCRQGELTAARNAFRALVDDEGASQEMLRDAYELLTEHKWQAEADDELDQAIEAETATVAATAIWAKQLANGPDPSRLADQLLRLSTKQPPSGREAILVYAQAMTNSDQAEKAVATVQRFSELLREDDESWAKAGTILFEAKNIPLAMAWLSDWEQRDDVQPWMLRTLIDAHRSLGQTENARQLLQKAEELAEAVDDILPLDLKSWLILDLALQAETKPAQRYLDEIDELGISDSNKLILALGKALLQLQKAESAQRKTLFREVLLDIQAAIGACEPSERPAGLGQVYPEFVRELVKSAGSLQAKWWGLRQRIRPWLPV